MSLRLLLPTLLIMLVAAPGCTRLSDSSKLPTVAISDVGVVAGQWKGTVQKVGGVFSEGTIRLSIRENGTFLFSNDRLTGVRVGAGRLIKQDGILLSDEDRLHVTFTLHETNGSQTLIAEGFARSGDRFYAGIEE